jgi:hypothetical protein
LASKTKEPAVYHHILPPIQHGDLPRNFSGMQHIIGVQKLKNVAFGQLDAPVAGDASAPVRPRLPADSVPKGLQNLNAPVSGAVINDNHFNRLIGLIQTRLNGCRHPRPGVIARNNNADERMIHFEIGRLFNWGTPD